VLALQVGVEAVERGAFPSLVLAEGEQVGPNEGEGVRAGGFEPLAPERDVVVPGGEGFRRGGRGEACAQQAGVVGDGQARSGAGDQPGAVAEGIADGRREVVLRVDVGSEGAFRPGSERFQPVQYFVAAVAGDRLLAAELRRGVVALEPLDAVFEFDDAVLQVIDPLLGRLAFAHGLGAALGLGVAFTFEVALCLFELLDPFFQSGPAEQLIEHRLERAPVG